MTRNRIFGIIGIVWGGLIILSRLFGGAPAANGAYASGQSTGLIFGFLLLIIGAFRLIKG